jgi:hypothetical protein
MLHRVVSRVGVDRRLRDRISETSVSIYQTAKRNIPEDSHLHTRRRENLTSHPSTP